MHLNIANSPKTYFAPEAVEAAAATLQADEDDWTYVVRHDPKGTGYSFIEVHDESGEVIGVV